MDDLIGYNQGASQPHPIEKMVRQPTLKERLAFAVEQAEKKLQDTKRAKEILDKNPELEELLNIMQRGNF